MGKIKHIRCAECLFAEIDHKASVYSQKRCGKCEKRYTCKIRSTDGICEKQTLKWAAIQCVCSDSDYHRALLNVTPHGGMQEEITWHGCKHGVGRCDL